MEHRQIHVLSTVHCFLRWENTQHGSVIGKNRNLDPPKAVMDIICFPNVFLQQYNAGAVVVFVPVFSVLNGRNVVRTSKQKT